MPSTPSITAIAYSITRKGVPLHAGSRNTSSSLVGQLRFLKDDSIQINNPHLVYPILDSVKLLIIRRGVYPILDSVKLLIIRRGKRFIHYSA